MEPHTHQTLMELREFLKRYQIFVYTGSQLDDLALMELELDDLYESGQLEAKDFQRYKLALRTAYRAAGGS